MTELVVIEEDLKHNIDRIKKYVNSDNENNKKVEIIAVVKANSYGLGLIQYVKLLIENGISYFAVATLEEAIELRKNNIKGKILMLSATAIKEEIEQLIKNDIIITISSKEDIEIVEDIGNKLNKKINAHLKIDTGFGRYGFIYQEKEKLKVALEKIKNINIIGTYSHFSISFYDDEYTKMQYIRFMEVIEYLKQNNISTGMLHICNSSAALKSKEYHLDAVRIGSAFLGRLSFINTMGLKKIGHLESRVTETKKLPKGFNIGYSNIYKTKNETDIAIIPVGYMNGLNVKNDKDMFRFVDKLRYIWEDVRRIFKNNDMYIEINGKRCRILGKIGTYHLTCNITGKDIKIGDIAKINIHPKFVDSSIRREYR